MRGQRKPAILLSQRNQDHRKPSRTHQFSPTGTCHIHVKPGWSKNQISHSPTRLRSSPMSSRKETCSSPQELKTIHQIHPCPTATAPGSVTSGTGGSARLQGREQSLLISGKKWSTLVCTAFAYKLGNKNLQQII